MTGAFFITYLAQCLYGSYNIGMKWVNVQIDESLMDALKELARHRRTTVTGMARSLLYQEFVEAKKSGEMEELRPAPKK